MKEEAKADQELADAFRNDTAGEIIAALERGSEHPLAAAIVSGAQERGIAPLAASEFKSVTGKGVMFGNNVSHANNKSRRRFLPNLQSVRAVIDGTTRRVRVCSSCIRAGKVIKAA